ncbi:MAG: DUF4407 domain-containing protein [Microcoleus vaginatus WJT46-NPBG5]|jgi:membrane-anchored glycerophosphoryl diester phosphodiesterase (GDPDase)|nr:DUF4407 domain-containing protein [Microcoleus vaginatus WJT46-NPBG5]
MSKNISPQSPIQPLSIGNVVSAGVRIYRSHLKSYLWLALQASLWVMLPLVLLAPVSGFPVYFQANPFAMLALVIAALALLIYGFAKYYAFSALISRLAFSELINKPESVTTAKDKINSHFWSFFWLSIRIGCLLFLVYFGLAFVGGLFSVILGAVLSSIFGRMGNLLSLIPLVLIILFGLTWFFSRWLVAEVPLAVEEGFNIRQSIARSWELSKKSAFRIQAILLIGFLVSVPLVLVTNFLPSIFLLGVEPNSPRYWIVYFISLITGLLGSALVLPFWQTIKAVLYYDLRSRREGLGLKLRDREV